MIQLIRNFRHSLWAVPFALVCAACLLPGAAIAEGFEIQSTTGSGEERPALTSLTDLGLEVSEGTTELSLEDAIETALERNLSLDVQRLSRDQSLLGIDSARGIYDLNLEIVGTYNSDTSPPSSTLQQANIITTDFLRLNNTLTQLTPYGGTASIQFDNREIEFSDQAIVPNPRDQVDLDFSFTQPLMRGFSRRVTEQGLIVARNNSAISREEFQLQVETVVADVIAQYWSLVEARKQLTVAEESLELAKDLHNMNRIQVEVGTKAPLEMVQSEVGVATREEDIIRLTATVEDAADNLRQLINLDRGSLWGIGIVPVTDPEIEHEAIDVRAAVDTALGHRPDIRRLELNNANLDVQAEVAENDKKPRLDVFAQYALNGLTGGYSDALQQVVDRSFKGWTVQATFAMPLQNRQAKADSAQADLAVVEGNAQLRNLQQQVLTEVRRSARAVETAAKQIESARISSKLARRNLDAERKRYENGLSTSFQVLEIQEDLSNAQSREVSAVINYRRALSSYHQALGTLLTENEIEVAAEN